MKDIVLKFTLVKGRISHKLETDPREFNASFFLDSLLDRGFRDGDLFELNYVGNKNIESWRTK